MSRPQSLKLLSYLSPNMFWFYEAVGAYLERVFALETQIVQSVVDPLCDRAMWDEELDMVFICGLPFIRYHRQAPTQLEALVAPVMQASRYQERPVYFADAIVNAASDIQNFDDLAGKTLCYNDKGSNSGYNLLRYRLIQGRYSSNFFGKVIPSGFHQRSIKWVVDGLAECSVIDSTVLEQELRNSPQLSQHLRIIESLGPCAMPPVVAAKRLGTTFIDELKFALLNPDLELQSAMERAQIKGYAAVCLEDYFPIGRMYDAAVAVNFEIGES
ncbi:MULTISPECIES: phosphate/phosphite/phosphonate ABC transporter substrate-binding protein [Aerosakkonema]|uniref:phosphate/phosphite/phosphonate ABC transporter substrate-binding protein n=1 Tax=Aerosakkonema TaxID=1246629 RepID=UPI0035B70002